MAEQPAKTTLARSQEAGNPHTRIGSPESSGLSGLPLPNLATKATSRAPCPRVAVLSLSSLLEFKPNYFMF
ncbi:hypothetical protein J6590_043437 [Homalodisca vitripennis]|nr:hypothetical protein J6590_043437 [Homalodisca vitripennis]